MPSILIFSARCMEFGGGLQNWIMTVAPALVEKYGYEVALVDTSYGLPRRIPTSKVRGWAERNEILYERLPTPSSVPIPGPRAIAKARRLRRNADLVYYSAGIPSFDLLFGPGASSKPSIAGWHGPLMVRSRLQNLYTLTARRLVAGSFAAHHVLNYSDAFALRRLGLQDVFVVPLGIDVRRWAPQPSKWNDRVFRITFLGRAEWDKGFDVLVEIVKSFLRENQSPDISVSIAGAGSMLPLLDSVRDSRCSFLGHVQDPEPLLSGSHCVLFPSRLETFGISILEAMSTGNVVVSSRTPGSILLVRDTESGFFVSSTREFVDRLNWAYRLFRENRGLLEKMGAQARSRALENFSTEKHLERFDAMIRFAMGRKRHKPGIAGDSRSLS
jgi:glycosyltransferase involved in cell wall biosynthesis